MSISSIKKKSEGSEVAIFLTAPSTSDEDETFDLHEEISADSTTMICDTGSSNDGKEGSKNNCDEDGQHQFRNCCVDTDAMMMTGVADKMICHHDTSYGSTSSKHIMLSDPVLFLKDKSPSKSALKCARENTSTCRGSSVIHHPQQQLAHHDHTVMNEISAFDCGQGTNQGMNERCTKCGTFISTR